MKRFFSLSLAVCFILLSFEVSAQFRMVGGASWTTLTDSTFTGTVTFKADLTGIGYDGNDVADTFRVFTGIEQHYDIINVLAQTSGTATITIKERGGDHGSPFGQVMVYDPSGLTTIPTFPAGNQGATFQLNAAIASFNARLVGTGGVDLSPYPLRTELADSTAAIRADLAGGGGSEINDLSSIVTWAIVPDAFISQTSVTQHEGAIDHNALTNYDVAQHRTINDVGTGTTDLWSASKINTELGGNNGIFSSGNDGGTVSTSFDINLTDSIILEKTSVSIDDPYITFKYDQADFLGPQMQVLAIDVMRVNDPTLALTIVDPIVLYEDGLEVFRWRYVNSSGDKLMTLQGANGTAWNIDGNGSKVGIRSNNSFIDLGAGGEDSIRVLTPLPYISTDSVLTKTPSGRLSMVALSDIPGSAEVNDLTASVTWANVPDANITQASVTQHQAALTITESQISDLSHFSPTDIDTDYGVETVSSVWNFLNLGDVTFQTGASGGTLRTGVSNADKFTLQAYDVDGGSYTTLLEADAGNSPILQMFSDYLFFEDATDPTRRMTLDISGVTTATTRTLTVPDASGTIALTSDITSEVNDLTASVTWTNVPDANITQSSVTQHQAALTITESQISDLSHVVVEDAAYSAAWNGDLDAATKNAIYDKIESISGAGEANTASNAGSGQSLFFQKVVADLQFYGIKSENNLLTVALDGVTNDIELTVNQGNISITESQISDLSHFGGTANDLTDVFNSTPADRHVLVYDGVTDNRYENRLLVEADISDLQSYLTAEVNNLTAAVTWANVPDANITQTSVTQHQAALTITESQISDLSHFTPSTIDTDYGTETVTSAWTFQANSGVGDFDAYDLNVGGATYGGIKIGGAGIYRTSAGLSAMDFDGTMVLRNETNLGVGNDPGIEFVIMEGGNTARFMIPESGTGNATAMFRSVTIAGPYSQVNGNQQVTGDFWTTNDSNLDFDTGATGADLFVQDDIEAGGTLFVDVISEEIAATGVTIDGLLIQDGSIPQAAVTEHQAALTITESQISDLSHFGGTANDLTDVFNSTPADRHVLIYDGVTDNRYENRLLVEADISDLQSYLTTETNDLTASVTWANVPNANITQGSVTQHEGAINHDNLLGFVANEHIDHSTLDVIAGTALAGGGALTGDVTLNLDIDEMSPTTTPNGTADHFAISDGGTESKITLQEVFGGAPTSQSTNTFDWGSNMQHTIKMDMTSFTSGTFTFSNPISGGWYAIIFQNVSGTDAVTWPTSVKEPNGTAFGTANVTESQIIVFFYDGTDFIANLPN